MRLFWIAVLGASLVAATPALSLAPPEPPITSGPQGAVLGSALDAEIRRAMAETGAKGLAAAIVNDGQVTYVRAFGARNARDEPLTRDTVMYGASLTKAVFAWTVMQLVEEGKLDLDRSIADYLPRPLTDYGSDEIDDRYARWSDLAGDERWRKLTPRILLSHRGGFANFAWLEPDGKVRIRFEPGARYAYSGQGLMLLQFVLEEGLKLDMGAEMQRRVFDRFGMANTSMTWRPGFAANLADGWKADGSVEPHDERSKVRAAGSMDTTIADFAKFAAAYVRGEGLTAASRAELVRAQAPITTPGQFPTFLPELPPPARRPDLATGLGVIVFEGPQGRGFYKGGHNDSTGNTWVCVEKGRRCVVLLANDVRAERAFPRLVRAALGETNVPWTWEYGPEAATW